MKKEYLVPEMEVVKLQMNQHLLDGSLPQGQGEMSADQADAPSWFGGNDEDW